MTGLVAVIALDLRRLLRTGSRLRLLRDPHSNDGGGTAALAMVLASLKVPVPLDELRSEVTDDDGRSNALRMVHAAERHGLDARGVKLWGPAAFHGLSLPCVLHLHGDTFVVVERVTAKHVTVIDAASGRHRVSHADLWARTSGVALLVTRHR